MPSMEEISYEVGYLEGLRQALYILLHSINEEENVKKLDEVITNQDKLVKRITVKKCFSDGCENEFHDILFGDELFCWECRY